MKYSWLPLSILSVFLIQCASIQTKNRGALGDTKSSNVKTKQEMFSARPGSELRKRIIVLPFLNHSAYDNDTLLQDARDRFIDEVQRTDDVIVLDWKSLGITQLAEYRDGNNYKIMELVKKLRSSGVHAIVEGTIKDLRTGKKGDSIGVFRRVQADVKAMVELKVYSVRSGKVMASEERQADASESYTRIAEKSFTDKELRDNPDSVRFVVYLAFEKTVPVLIDSLKKFSWEGRVALVKGEKVYLNAGRLSGLQVGDLLRIVEPQEEVFDPETSQFIGQIKGRMKGTVEVTNYFGTDGAVTQIHSGSGFKENDLVEFY